MAWHVAKPPMVKASSGSGISVALRVTKRTRMMRFTMNADAQRRLFGDLIAGKKLSVQVGYGSHEGQVAIQLLSRVGDEDRPIEVTRGIKDSVAFLVAAWDLLPREKRPAAWCELREVNGGLVVLDLPDWCRPSRTGGRIAAEHGLAPVPRAQKAPEGKPAARLAEQGAALGRAAKG